MLSAQTYRPPASLISAATYERPPAMTKSPRVPRPVMTVGFRASGTAVARALSALVARLHLAIQLLRGAFLVQEERHVLQPLGSRERRRLEPFVVGDDRDAGAADDGQCGARSPRRS